MYTVSIALNSAGIDYQGGGFRFIRRDCAVRNVGKGWALLHPGQMTHLHEGLPVVNGSQYVLVSYVDPPD